MVHRGAETWKSLCDSIETDKERFMPLHHAPAYFFAMLTGTLLLPTGCSNGSTSGPPDGGPSALMSFFISSDTGSGNLGGLAGADARCQRLAETAGVTGKQWAAYLSTAGTGSVAGVNAKDRIGTGPWYNFAGVKIADNVAGLHDMTNVNLNKQTALTEKGQVVNGRGDTPNQHDILTGSELDGAVTTAATCADWSSDTDSAKATVGHHDRNGGGTNPTSWNSAHQSSGCSAQALVSTGGAGRIYCFATR